MKYAIELAVKFEAESDSAAKEMTKVVVSSLEAVLDATHTVTQTLTDVDEIRLIDDGFGGTYGENRIIDISETFGSPPTESEEA